MAIYYKGAGTTQDPRKYYSDEQGNIELPAEQSKSVDITTAIPLKVLPQATTATNSPIVPQRTPRKDPTQALYDDLITGTKSAQETADTSKEAQRKAVEEQLNARIAQIEGQTQRKIREEQALGEENLAKTGAINIRAGLLGSDFAESARTKTKSITNQAVEKVRQIGEEEKAIAQSNFSTAIQNIEDRYTTRLDSIRKEQQGILTSRAQNLETNQKEALTDLQTMAKSGRFSVKDLDKVIDTDGRTLVDEMAEQTGKSPEQLRLLVLANKPAGTVLNKDKPNIVNGRAYYFVQEPDGSVSTEEVKLPDGFPMENYDKVHFIEETGDMIYYNSTDPNIPPQIVGGMPVKPKSATEQKTINAEQRAKDTAISNAKQALLQIDELLNDKKALSSAVGTISSKMPTLRGKTADFERKFEALKALITLPQLQQMRGLGAMSDKEFGTLQKSATALDLRMSEQGFVDELNLLKEKMNKIANANPDQLSAPVVDQDALKSDLESLGYNQQEIDQAFAIFDIAEIQALIDNAMQEREQIMNEGSGQGGGTE